MGMECAVTGKKPAFGNQKTYRGKAKYLGGVGRKITGTSGRKFKPNLQKVKVVINGKVKTVRVAVSALRSGLVHKPIKRKLFSTPQL
ncbi:50S ribosomal protein L28 [Telmatocola sphagniphila]|uniref:Large ribosomal subunit protein bL28 n=1 Tax=Telmatocola sphagniphila TaxID=1123043 RepID=A0A8E6B5G0_9BACT|nr:50S ribosomal protein L28 [Telmatocola sphagniphila]QVL31814.1 50S ribosomal protein L28 [Telmatocola sphagniphila]